MDIGNGCTTTESVQLKESNSTEFQIHGCVRNDLLTRQHLFNCSITEEKKMHSNFIENGTQRSQNPELTIYRVARGAHVEMET